MRSVILNIIFLLTGTFSFAQILNTQPSKPYINIGERVVITFSILSSEPLDSIAYLPENGVFHAKSSASGDTTSISTPYELEIMRSFSDTLYQENGDHIWKGTYEVTGWDSAFVVIPPEQVVVNDSVMYFPAALIEVATPKADPSKPIRDINEEFTEVEKVEGIMDFLKKNALWIVIILLVIIVAVILIYFSRKGKERKQLSLREITLKEIDELEKSKSYENDLKEYYFDLSLIVRRFFSKHYGERMLDKTSSEIEELLAKKGLETSTIEVVRRILNQSDLVKFAKSEPPISDVFVVTNDARRVVNEIAALEINDE